MESLPASLAERLRELTYNERAVAYLQVDAALTLVGAGGHLENYGLAAIRLGEPAVEQAFFLEGPTFIFISTPALCGWCCSTSRPTATRSAVCSKKPMK